MIQKFSADGIGCLIDLQSPELQKQVLIFGENGSGKSTLTAMFRSLMDNNPEPIHEREPVGRSVEPAFSVTIAGKEFEFEDGTWTAACDRLAIFDQTYINENLHSGDQLENDHRKKLYTVILGNACADQLREQAELAEEILLHNRSVKETETTIKGKIPDSITFDEFMGLAPAENVGKAIAAQQAVVTRFEQSEKLNRADGFEPVELPRLPGSFRKTLEQTIQNLTGNAEARVSEHLSGSTRGASTQWIEQGLEFQKDDACPFCGQDVSTTDLIKTYNDFFNEEYNSLKSGINSLSGLVDGHFGESILLGHQKRFSANEAAATFWEDHLEVPPLDHSVFDELANELGEVRDRLQEQVATKQLNPLEAVSGADPQLSAELISRIDDYNTLVSVANKRIDDLRETQKQGDLGEEQQKLAEIEAAGLRHSADMKSLIATRMEGDAIKAKNSDRRHDLQTSIDEETAQVFEQQGSQINAILEQLDAGFRLGQLVTNNRTKPPSVQLVVEINEQNIQLGDKVGKTARPFRSTLSSAERTMLAFAFFVSKLEQDDSLESQIVIFDDPVTSLDQTRLEKTAGIISNVCAGAAQLILLSHNAAFLKLIDLDKPQQLVLNGAGERSVLA